MTTSILYVAAPATEISPVVRDGVGVGLTSLAFTVGAILFMAIRNKSTPVRKLFDDERNLAGLAAVFGVLSVLAGGTWRAIALGAQDISSSTLSDPNIAAGATPMGTALILTVLAFLPEWTRRLPPAFLGLIAGVSWGVAGGYFGILYKIIGGILGRFS
ncbi:hypothetical protein [Streptomyces sp. NPDC002215]|uniref:hypothetical protein n=1 Tax=Streptomyces sp. NPDC002215 TaxID=3154412 RepID=UPI003322FE9B